MKYELTDEHCARLPEWRGKWTANALRVGPYSDDAKQRCRTAMRDLYCAAGLTPPRNEVFCASPTSAAIADAIAHGVWWLRENPAQHKALFGRELTAQEIDHACHEAVAAACGIKTKATDAATDAATTAATDAATYAATRAATYAATRDATEDATTAATDAATDAATRDATEDATTAATYAATDAATWAATDAATRAATRAAIDAATRAATDAPTGPPPRPAIDAATRAATDAATWAATDAATRAATRDATEDAVRFLLGCCSSWHNAYQGGNHWSGYVAFLSFFRHVAKLPIDYSKWDAYERAAEFGPRFVHAKFWIVSEYPDFVHRDDQNRPHCETGPFCRWRDGRELFYWHGTQVPREWIEQRDTLDPATALTWQNVEQRRAAAEIVGWKRVLEHVGARSIDKDSDPMIGELVECDLPDSPRSRFIKVLCGTNRDFVLPVPTACRTAIEANKWTYDYDGSDNDFRAFVRT